MKNHAEREHAVLSASGAHRWLQCTPSARLEEQFPDTTSEAAAEGTIAHELAEAKLRHALFPKEFNKRALNARIKELQANPLWNDEMQGYTDDYVDLIQKLTLMFKVRPSVRIEYRFSLEAYIPDGFGTADCVVCQGDSLYIIDFKYGKGKMVNAKNNPQLMLYALGVYESYRLLYDFRHIYLWIVQPRLDHVDDVELTPEELLAFGEHVKERAKLAYAGEGEFVPGEEQCLFCRAKAQCRARAEQSVQLAFSADLGKLPPLISDEMVGQYLKQGEQVAAWLSDLKEYALSACLAGKEIAGYKAVEGRRTRNWSDMDAAFQKLLRSGMTEEAMLYERKPLTLAQVEKLIGKKDFADAVGEYVVTAAGKPTLVPESDKRVAITNQNKANEVFKEESK